MVNQTGLSNYMTFIVCFCEVYICRRNTDDLVQLIATYVCLMHSLETLTNTHSQCMYIKVSGHVLPRLTIP